MGQAQWPVPLYSFIQEPNVEGSEFQAWATQQHHLSKERCN